MQAAGHAGRELEGRGLAGPARDQLPLRRRAHDRGQPHGLQERREGDRAPRTAARSRSWRSRTTRGSATPATSTARSGATASTRSRTSGLFGALPRRLDRVRAGARGLPRAERQLVQALRRGLVGADDARVGERQPHVRLPRRRARPLAARRDADPRRRREPVPRVRGARSRPGCTGSSTGSSRRPRSRATRTSPTPSASRRRCARRSRRSSRGRWRARRSATTSSTTTSTTRRTEQRLFDEVVTCYERERLFERA